MPSSSEGQSGDVPNFQSLAQIMEHFSKVPFDQFKEDLNHWFKLQCSEKALIDEQFRKIGGADFPEALSQLVERIYSEAEELHRQNPH